MAVCPVPPRLPRLRGPVRVIGRPAPAEVTSTCDYDCPSPGDVPIITINGWCYDLCAAHARWAADRLLTPMPPGTPGTAT